MLCSHPSFPRKRAGGFTFQVQHAVPKCCCRGLVVQALARGVVVGLKEWGKPRLRQGSRDRSYGAASGATGRWTFSTPPFCQDEWVSQQKVSLPSLWRREWRAHAVPLSPGAVWRQAGGKGASRWAMSGGDGAGGLARRAGGRGEAESDVHAGLAPPNQRSIISRAWAIVVCDVHAGLAPPNQRPGRASGRPPSGRGCGGQRHSRGRSVSGRRNAMKAAGLPPLRPRQPHCPLARGREWRHP